MLFRCMQETDTRILNGLKVPISCIGRKEIGVIASCLFLGLAQVRTKDHGTAGRGMCFLGLPYPCLQPGLFSKQAPQSLDSEKGVLSRK